MLLELHIQNLVIFDEIRQPLGKGLNVLTGETGAGKSLLAGALGLLLGERGDPGQIRSGEDQAMVEALFDVEQLSDTRSVLEEMGLEVHDDLVLRRVLRRGSRGSAAVNGSLVPLAQLSRVTETLISIVGQHSHQRLLRPSHHLTVLDRFAGVGDDVAKLTATLERWRSVHDELLRSKGAERDRAERLEFLEQAIEGIEGVEPRAGEDHELEERREVLRHAEQLDRAAALGVDRLYDGEAAAIDVVVEVRQELGRAARHDAVLVEVVTILDTARVALDEAARQLVDYRARLSNEPAELEAIEARLDRLDRLKRKHGDDLVRVLERLEEMREERDGWIDAPARAKELAAEEADLDREVRELADALHRARVKASGKLAQALQAELGDLGMAQTRVEIEVEEADVPADAPSGPRGRDAVRFLLAANPGENPRPLDKVASGGELARILLAVTRVAGAGVQTPVVLFDEVDTGIGGGVAEVVGRKLKEIASDHQVLCITHLPQIASLGDLHLRVSKQARSGRTLADLREVRGEDRVQEIARMLGGVELTSKAMAHAEEMLSR